ncbi:MAG: cation:proton antiporter [Deltaproteobacteria bacterium]|nr:cation:proton antiporter [Deltaproteobacteria bacterium]
MTNGHDVLGDLAVVLCVAAVTTVVFQRLRQPVVLGYVLAGILAGPQMPISLVSDTASIHTLSELGVTLLMFSLGLEFSVRKLLRVGLRAAVTVAVEVGTMLWLGFNAGRLLGWSVKESLLAGGLVAISSTMIVARELGEHPVESRLKSLVLGVLVFEDLAAIVLLTLFTAMGHGLDPTTDRVLDTLGRMGLFLGVVVVLGMLLVPRLVRALLALKRAETLLVAAVGLCFLMALVARELGYSVALGAFLAGSLVAESGGGQRVEKLVEPLRDLFGAVFFVSVGMLVEPGTAMENLGAVALLAAVVVGGKLVGVTLGSFLTGHGVATSLQAGLTLGQIGEFSFIIATLGQSAGMAGRQLFPVAVTVSVLTTFLTPWLIRAARPFAAAVDRRLPRPVQTFVTLYGSWLDRLGATSTTRTTAVRRLLGLLAADVALVITVVVGTSVLLTRLLAQLAGAAGVPQVVAQVVILASALLLSLPAFWGLVTVSRRLAEHLSRTALPSGERSVDMALAPRRVLVLSLQLVILVVAGIPVLAVTQPFLPPFGGAPVLVVPVVALAVLWWRSTRSLEGHVKAGAMAILDALGQAATVSALAPDLSKVEELLPGCGTMVSVRLGAGAPGVGQTLGTLNVRGLTGATVVAIQRGHGGMTPTAQDVLREGDVLALIGTDEAVAAAQHLLADPA